MKRVSISQIAEVNPRLPGKLRADDARPVSFVAMADVSEGGFVATYQERRLQDVVKGYTYFGRGDVLSAKITPCMQNGKAAVTDTMPHQIGFGSTEFHVLRPGPEVVGRYLFHMIWSPYYRRSAERSFTGTAGQQRVPTDFFDRFKIPLPPLSEQKRIAAILDKADALRRKRQQALQLSEQFLRSTFLDMFGDPVHNPRGLPWTSLDELAKVTGGFAFKSEWFEPTGRKVIRISDIQNGYVDTSLAVCLDAEKHTVSSEFSTRRGDLLMALSGATTGKIGVVTDQDDGAFVNQRVAIIRAHSPEVASFLRWTLNDTRVINNLLRTAGGSAQANLSPNDLRACVISSPTKATMEAFARIESTTEIRLRRAGVDALRNVEVLFASLVQRAFRGEL